MSTDPSTPENDANLSGLGRALLESKEGSKPSGPWVPPTAEELGKLLPEYDIVKMLGRGGMGAVYMGRQKSLDRPVAIKILSTALEDADPSFAERFKNEARAMGKLNFAGIVAVHDFGEAKGGLLYIVMEYVEGTDVARMIAKEGRLHTEHAMAITAHVCDALQYAHERGIIHRDIKPANIMVGYDGVVKVADFGLAKMTQSPNTGLTQSGMAMGTLHYMAPEALMLGSVVDHRADIYAVGVMLYQMLTGKLPQGMFELPSLQIPGLDPRYDAIIAKALREDRSQRYQGVSEMRRDLDGILTQPVAKVEPEVSQAPAALPTQARPQRPGGQPYRPPQSVVHAPMPKSSSGWLVWAVLGACALGGGYFWMTSQSPKPDNPAAIAETAPKPLPPNPFEAVDPPDQPMPSASVAPVQSSTVILPTPAPSVPAFDLQQLPDFRIRIANYQKARHTKLSDLTMRYRAALTEAKSRAPADAAAYDMALAHAAALMTEIEKNLTAIDVKPLPPIANTGGPAPQRVKELRDIFAGETAKLETGLVTDLDQSLSVVQASMTQAGRLDAAKALEDYRAQLAAVAFIMAGSKQPGLVSITSNAAAPVSQATKDKPFVNSLGMKFVPVPGTQVLFCIHETRKGDYAAYTAANPSTNDEWQNVTAKGGIVSPSADHPVVNVNRSDAQNFCVWLSQKDGQKYRLPTDREWSFAVGIGERESATETPASLNHQLKNVYPWGTVWPPPKNSANLPDTALRAMSPQESIIQTYTDGYATTAPVMSFNPNKLGLYDLAGNVWEWCEDRYDPSTDGLARGSTWFHTREGQFAKLSSHRQVGLPGIRNPGGGFRVVLELP